jgi:hypothetical protein
MIFPDDYDDDNKSDDNNSSMLMLEVRINFNDDDHRGNGNYILF